MGDKEGLLLTLYPHDLVHGPSSSLTSNPKEKADQA